MQSWVSQAAGAVGSAADGAVGGAPFRLGLIVGGVQKAGTTALFDYLRHHPQLCPPARKETHFFDDERIDWSAPDWARLAAFYDCADGRVPFDVTPIYLFWPPALERIRAHDPQVRLVFLFRDPIERAWSHWRMELRRNADDLPFPLAIRQGRWRLRGIPPLDPAWRVYSYVERGFYGRQVRRLLALFPRDRVLFLAAGELAADHRRVLDRIAGFAGLSPFPPAAPLRAHEAPRGGERLAPEDVAYLRTLYRDDLADFAALTGIDVTGWLTMREDEA